MFLRSIVLGCAFGVAQAATVENQASLSSAILCATNKLAVLKDGNKYTLGEFPAAAPSFPLLGETPITADGEITACDFDGESKVLLVVGGKMAWAPIEDGKTKSKTVGKITTFGDSPLSAVAGTVVTDKSQKHLVYLEPVANNKNAIKVYPLKEDYTLGTEVTSTAATEKECLSLHSKEAVKDKNFSFLAQSATGLLELTVQISEGVTASSKNFDILSGAVFDANVNESNVWFNTYFGATKKAEASAVLLKANAEKTFYDFVNVTKSQSPDLKLFEKDLELKEEASSFPLKIGKSTVAGYWTLSFETEEEAKGDYNVVIVFSDAEEGTAATNSISITVENEKITVDRSKALPYDDAEPVVTEDPLGVRKFTILLDAKTLYISVDDSIPQAFAISYKAEKAFGMLSVSGKGKILKGSKVYKVQGIKDDSKDPWKGFGAKPFLASLLATLAGVLVALF